MGSKKHMCLRGRQGLISKNVEGTKSYKVRVYWKTLIIETMFMPDLVPTVEAYAKVTELRTMAIKRKQSGMDIENAARVFANSGVELMFHFDIRTHGMRAKTFQTADLITAFHHRGKLIKLIQHGCTPNALKKLEHKLASEMKTVRNRASLHEHGLATAVITELQRRTIGRQRLLGKQQPHLAFLKRDIIVRRRLGRKQLVLPTAGDTYCETNGFCRT